MLTEEEVNGIDGGSGVDDLLVDPEGSMSCFDIMVWYLIVTGSFPSPSKGCTESLHTVSFHLNALS